MGLVRLGLLSTAGISAKLLAGATGLEDVLPVAVGGRDLERTRAFAADHGIGRAHGSYEALLADPEVDAVYVALPNALHVEWALRAVRAGKHVLVEKPLSTDPAAVEALFDAAHAAGVVVMEAFMWRHHPQVSRLIDLVAGGAIGELRAVRATFSFTLDRPHDIRWDAALGGGSLLDVGTYCVNAARLLAGDPEEVAAFAVLAPSGVDVRFSGLMRHAGSVLATFQCGFDLPYEARVEAVGADATVRLTDPFHGHDAVVENVRGDAIERERFDRTSSYELELGNFAAAVQGEASPLLNRADSVGQARTLQMLLEAAAA